ncbi:hypothetical protein [Marinospirillum celere]|uniref:hypothetical protein n=1 Tax=Marinospirillum celere TaxID=1122252 RepID=UPI000B813715|nr:hypothetical protein [Marinospirillum celere]
MAVLFSIALFLQPWSFLTWGLLPIMLGFLLRWQNDFGSKRPVSLDWEAGRLWMTTRQGELLEVSLPALWTSYCWLAFQVKGRPWGLKSWLLWPDMLSAADRQQLRVLVRSFSQVTSGPV